MIYTVEISRLMVDASSLEEAQELATEYFKDEDFKVRLSEITPGDKDREDTRQGRDEI